MPGASMRWQAATAPTKKTAASAARSQNRRRCRRLRSSAAPTASAPGKAAWKGPRRSRRASRSKAVIAGWAIIRLLCMRSPTGSRSLKDNGSLSTAPAGARPSTPIRTGSPLLPNYAEDEVGEGLGRMACQGSVLEGQGWWQYRTDHQFIPALGPVLVLHRITAAYYRGERASV